MFYFLSFCFFFSFVFYLLFFIFYFYLLFLFFVFTVSPCLAQAQFSKPEEKFPADETYLYPIYPGQPGSLAGTMGELRTTHFHSGIDIRTNNMIGMPVRASKRLRPATPQSTL